VSGAVQFVADLVAEGAVHRDRQRIGGIRIRRRIGALAGDRTGRHVDQGGGIPAVQRQILDIRFGHDLA
jgi:hypothetical protein